VANLLLWANWLADAGPDSRLAGKHDAACIIGDWLVVRALMAAGSRFARKADARIVLPIVVG
jgi:hypothetical protein